MDLVALLPLLKITCVLGLVILLIRLSSRIGLALGIGAGILGLAFSMSPSEMLAVSLGTLLSSQSLLLTLVVTLIVILSASLEHLGHLRELLVRFKNRLGERRWGLVAFPALIGLLPMPGGAVFSAPMLDSFDTGKKLIPSLKSFLNYWYRHIWEYWWPLYPALLLMCAIVQVNLWHYILLALPMTAIAMLAGLPQLMQISEPLGEDPSRVEPKDGSTVWSALSPLLLAIVPGVGFALFLQFGGASRRWLALPKETGLVIGLLAAIGWAWWDRGIRIHQARQILLDSKLPRMWFAVAGVFLFKGIMEGSGAAHEVGVILFNLKVPLVLVIVFLPMVLGIISGWTIAFVGTAFPILAPLIQGAGAADIKLPLTLLAFVSGFTGVILSPVHLCLILSNEYFQAPWSKVYGRLWLPALMVLGGGIIYFAVLRMLIG
ncbi:MAG: DUF401 family protein [Deltaproteobacteria bacterium]|nr:DUF401 family protein [Deltaproteobacteria bacterium]